MRSQTLLALIAASSASSALAQTVNATYFQDFLAALGGAGLSTLSTLALNLTNSTLGATLLTALPGSNKTFFAPSNEAFSNLSPNISSNITALAEVVSYHILTGVFNETNIAQQPNVTVARTFLNSTDVVSLPANVSQVVVLQRDGDDIEVRNQNAEVSRTLAYENLLIHVIDRVFSIPPPAEQALQANNLAAFQTAAQQAQILNRISNSQGITIFAPSDAAFQAAQGSLGNSGADVNTIAAILNNHIINGSAVYSTLFFEGGGYRSAGGQAFSFLFNNQTGEVSVQSGSSTARITSSDIIVENGVVHLIDAVLVNPASDPGAASSAFESATANPPQGSETAGVGGPGGNSAASFRVSATLTSLIGVAAVFVHLL